MDSLVRQNLKKELFEVIIVNNNSTDNTHELAEEYIRNNKNFFMIIETQQGLSASRNSGWKKARGKYVAFIDDDARASSTWCQRIIHAFENVIPSPTAVGGSIYPWYEIKPPHWFSDELEIRDWGKMAHYLEGEKAKWGFSGSNMAFNRNILEKYKGFSTKAGLIGNELRLGEDTDIFYRISKKEPLFWYDPQIKVFHLVPLRKMNFRYILLRAYKSGQSISMIEISSISFFNYWIKWMSFFLFIMKLPIIVLKKQKKSKIDHIKLIEQLAYKLGSLKKQAQLIKNFIR